MGFFLIESLESDQEELEGGLDGSMGGVLERCCDGEDQEAGLIELLFVHNDNPYQESQTLQALQLHLFFSIHHQYSQLAH